MLTLYDCAGAPNPRRARILLAEKRIAHETVAVDLSKGEQFGEVYRAINPQCTVPALRTPQGVVLTDNAAIAMYLEALFPEPPLLGRTPLQKAEVASWNWRGEFECLLPVAEAFRNGSPTLVGKALPGPRGYAQIPELIPRGVARVQDFFTVLDEHLKSRQFIAAERFSLADITVAVAVDFARVVKVRPPEHHANLRRWHDEICKRSSMAL